MTLRQKIILVLLTCWRFIGDPNSECRLWRLSILKFLLKKKEKKMKLICNICVEVLTSDLNVSITRLLFRNLCIARWLETN